MKPRIPFRIGYQIDNWEKDLVITADRFENDLYCSYLWAGKEQKKFLDYEPSSTELIFHWDRLEVVILKFESKDKELYEKINTALLNRFIEVTAEVNYKEYVIQKYKTDKVDYWNAYSKNTKETIVLYFSNSFPSKQLLQEFNKSVQIPYSLEELQKLLNNFTNEYNNLIYLMKTRELTFGEKHNLNLKYKHSIALKYYIKKQGNVSKNFISFHLYFLFKDRKNWE